MLIFYITFIIIIILIVICISYDCIDSFIETYYENKKKEASDIYIVYFAYLRPERWKGIVIGQMNDLIDTNMLQLGAKLHIVLSEDTGSDLIGICKDEILDLMKTKINDDIIYNIDFTLVNENTFEYPGIDILYQKANEHPDKIFLYFHSKGMVFHSNDALNNERLPLETALLREVVAKWQKALDVFNNNANISKVCLIPSHSGHCWYNFYFIKGEYLLNCEKPEISNDRYVYETYAADKCKVSEGDCYSLLDDDVNSKYDNYDAWTRTIYL